MDYTFLVLFGNGTFTEVRCATLTDVQDLAVEMIRRAGDKRHKVVSMTIIDNTIKEK